MNKGVTDVMTELVFILDRSGSMGGLESDTIGGFNSMLKKQEALSGRARVTTILFDDRYEVLHDRIDIRTVRPMTEKQYYVRGCTALLDAVGTTIDRIACRQKSVAKAHRAEKVLFVIITDGLENSSKQYTYGRVRQMIEKRKNGDKWEFIFLGANIDAVEEAARLGIREERAVTYRNDGRGVRKNYEAVDKFLTFARECEAPVGREWKREVEEDAGKR